MSELVVIDVTRANFDTEVAIVDNLLTETRWASENVVVLGLPRHEQPLAARFASVAFVPISGLVPERDVLDQLPVAVGRRAGVRRVYFFTFYRSLLDRAPSELIPGTEVIVQPLTRFAPRGAQRHAWPPDFMPVDEAIGVLQSVLAKSNGREVLKTSLRPLLAASDGRFDKDHPGAATPGLVSMLLAEAERRGLVSVGGAEPRVSVRLVGATPQTPLTVASRSHSEGMPTDERGDQLPPSRSDNYITALRGLDLGYQYGRHHVYDALENVVKNHPGLTLREALTRAIADARSSAGLGKFAWGGMRQCLERLMMHEPVALTEAGDAVQPTWRGLQQSIVALSDQWKERLDGVMIVELVRVGQPVDASSAEDLSGALFYRREQEHIDFVVRTIDLLLAEGRLRESGDGRFALAETDKQRD